MILSNNKILYRFHSGFWKNYSTKTCLRHITDEITTSFEKYFLSEMILIDLRKAFGTTDPQILIKKMKYIGFSKNAIAWFKSYLIEWKFKININTSYSSRSNLTYDILQGSILEPLLILLYVNDLPQDVVMINLNLPCKGLRAVWEIFLYTK